MAERLPKGIHKAYKLQWFDSLTFGAIMMAIRCGMTDYEAAQEIKKCFNLDEDNAPTRTILMRYYRTRDKFREVIKEEGIRGAMYEERFIDKIAKQAADYAIENAKNLENE